MKWKSLSQVGDDEWNFTYLIHSHNDRSNIVPTLGFEPRTSYTLGGCLTYCASYPSIGTIFDLSLREWIKYGVKFVFFKFVRSNVKLSARSSSYNLQIVDKKSTENKNKLYFFDHLPSPISMLNFKGLICS